jgi:hypothetical protein
MPGPGQQHKKADREGWASMVERMREKGAEIPDNEVQAVVDYLTWAHGQ